MVLLTLSWWDRTLSKDQNSEKHPDSSVGKESACNAGDPGLIPGLGRSLGEGKGYPLQYSGLENSMDCIVHGVAELDTIEWLSLSSLCSSVFISLHSLSRSIILPSLLVLTLGSHILGISYFLAFCMVQLMKGASRLEKRQGMLQAGRGFLYWSSEPSTTIASASATGFSGFGALT